MHILIIGAAGKVGSTTAYTLLQHNIPIQQISLYDVADVSAFVVELQQVVLAQNKDIHIDMCHDLSVHNADIIIFSAGASLTSSNVSDRNALLQTNITIVDKIFQQCTFTKDTLFIVVSNPVDMITHRIGQYVRNRDKVMGISTYTDTIRLHTFADGIVIGEHGGHMMTYPEKHDIETIRQLGLNIVQQKGGTRFITATLVSTVVKSIINDTQHIYPLSCTLKGEYGYKDITVSIPVMIGKNGIVTIDELSLSSQQQETFAAIAQTLQEKQSKFPSIV